MMTKRVTDPHAIDGKFPPPAQRFDLWREACSQHDVAIWFCGLHSVELHMQRVAARVSRGGHDIPADKIRARYDSSRENLLALLPDWHFTREPDSLTGYDELVIRPQN